MRGPGLAIIVLWIAFFVSWIAAALWSEKPAKRATLRRELGYRIAIFLGALLMAVPAHRYTGPQRLWFVTWDEAWICAAVIALGLGFTWWARLHLGRLWSASVTRKPGHRVIASGPYGIVRHPIYTGILLALYATAVAKGTVAGIVGALLMTFGFWLKARLEEQWLAQELGAGEYEAYRRRVPMLLPFGPTGA